MPEEPTAQTSWQPGFAVDLAATLAPLRRGGGDPTHRRTPDGAVWRTARTPLGPATLRLGQHPGEVRAQAWGPGAPWLIAGVPELLGGADDPAGFVPRHPLLREAARRWPGLRTPRCRLVFEMLVAAVLEQKVTGAEARRSWRELLHRFGAPAPGPAPAGMRVLPEPRAWRLLPSWEWHRAGVDAKRSTTIVTAAAVAGRLEQTLDLPAAAAARRLGAVPGVGVWTVAEVLQRAHGDADAVSVGNFHIPALIGWALVGHPLDDAGMLDLLAPYRPHRHRVVRLVELSGFTKPRFGPRYAGRDYRAI